MLGMENMTKQKSIQQSRGMRKLYAFGKKRSIDLSLSENPLGCSPLVTRVLQNNTIALNDYPAPNGRKLKNAVAEKLSCQSENIFVCNGSEAIINIIPRIFTKPGDEVIIPSLTFPLFSTCSELAGLRVTLAPMTENLAIDLGLVLNIVSKKSKIIFICNPNNPTGSVLTRDDLERFIRQIPTSVLIVVDEANIEFGGENVVDLALSAKNVIVLRTFSKGYGLANARIGFAVANKALITRLEEENPVFPVSGLSEELAIAALQDDAFIAQTKLFIKTERNRIKQQLEVLGCTVFPSAANNLFVKLPDRISSSIFLSAMEKADISLVNGSSFPGFDDSFFRVSPRTEKINTIFLNAVIQIMKGLE